MKSKSRGKKSQKVPTAFTQPRRITVSSTRWDQLNKVLENPVQIDLPPSLRLPDSD